MRPLPVDKHLLEDKPASACVAHGPAHERAAHQWERAARFYLEALSRGLDGPAPWVQLGHALKETGKIAEAEFAYRRALVCDGRNSDALVALGWVLRRQGRETEAAAVYRRALAFNPSPELHAFLCAELTALGSQADALPFTHTC